MFIPSSKHAAIRHAAQLEQDARDLLQEAQHERAEGSAITALHLELNAASMRSQAATLTIFAAGMRA